jgi:hypothetical protein
MKIHTYEIGIDDIASKKETNRMKNINAFFTMSDLLRSDLFTNIIC